MKAVLFGVGNYYRNRKEKICNIRDLKVVAFSDNREQLWGSYIDGIKIVSPIELLELEFDKVIITNLYTIQIVHQLLELGIEKTRIIFWGDYWAELVTGISQTYYADNNCCHEKKRILIISIELNYDGGSIAAVYAGMALQERGYDVVLAVPEGNMKLIREVVDSGITVKVCPALPHIKYKEIEWIAQFDAVIVNVISMVPCVVALSGFKPIVWWIHESVGQHAYLKDEYREGKIRNKLLHVQICTVSGVSKKIH